MAQLRSTPQPRLPALLARSTTGQSLAIRYDAQSNSVTFIEDDWFAGSFRSGAVPPREVVSLRLSPLSPIRARKR